MTVGGVDAFAASNTNGTNTHAEMRKWRSKVIGGSARVCLCIFGAPTLEFKVDAAACRSRALGQCPLNSGRIAVFCPFTIIHFPSAPRCSTYTISVRNTPFPFASISLA